MASSPVPWQPSPFCGEGWSVHMNGWCNTHLPLSTRATGAPYGFPMDPYGSPMPSLWLPYGFPIAALAPCGPRGMVRPLPVTPEVARARLQAKWPASTILAWGMCEQ